METTNNPNDIPFQEVQVLVDLKNALTIISHFRNTARFKSDISCGIQEIEWVLSMSPHHSRRRMRAQLVRILNQTLSEGEGEMRNPKATILLWLKNKSWRTY